MLIFVLAAQISAAQPSFIWFSNNDTPVAELAGKGTLRVLLRLTIPPDGRVHKCEIEQSSGNVRVDQLSCDLTRRRARFQPARSADGTESYGVYRVPVVWTLKRPKLTWMGDVTVAPRPKPKGVHVPATVRLIFAVDAAGRISNCSDSPVLPGMDKYNPLLVPIACDALRRGYSPRPAQDETGRAVPSIQNGWVLVTKS